jgi:hypothetical protein
MVNEQTEEQPQEESGDRYYEIENLTLSGTFTNCTFYINTGAVPDPPPVPPGGNN